jgi:potassium/hydrogen antiporter
MTELAAPQLDVDLLILGSAALLLVGAVATGLAERARIPSLVIFLGIGMLVADDGLALVRFDDAELARNLAVVALTIILFEGGLSTSWSRLRPRLAPAGALATLGVVLTAGLVAVAAAWILDLDATTALLLGAVISSTDAAAVFAVLRRAPVQGRLRDTLEAESGLNDPMAILLTVGLVAASTTDLQASDWFWFGARQLLLGVGGRSGDRGGRGHRAAPPAAAHLGAATGGGGGVRPGRLRARCPRRRPPGSSPCTSAAS